jgi:acyl-CoA reductase-like NAD-dependent aldehyde dehydrogenase
MLVGGGLSGALSGATFGVINPPTEEVVTQMADGAAGDMDRAVAAPRAAADDTPWGTARCVNAH